MLTLKEKLEALVRGEKLRSHYWPKKSYLYLDENDFKHEGGTVVEPDKVGKDSRKWLKTVDM